MPLKRLQLIISESGIASRRSAEKLIAAGQVRVNGVVVKTLGSKADPERDKIEIAGLPLKATRQELSYFIFHKPLGVTTTLSDPHAKKTLADFFGDQSTRLYPAGRLDKDSTGLLLVTNDGDLVNRLTHPRFGVEKHYQIVISRRLTTVEIKQLQSGIILDGKKTAPCQIRVSNAVVKKGVCIEMVLHEGRKRQIRRMMNKLNVDVLSLHRDGYGPLKLGSLKPGEKRMLSESEIDALKSTAHDKTH